VKEKEIALLYSGGLDTTYSAICLEKSFEKIHLLTFDNGFCLNPLASEKHVRILKAKYGKTRFVHTIIDIKGIFKRLKEDIRQKRSACGSPLFFDLCCRFSMESGAVVYCLKNHIRYISDGANPETQGQMFIQQRRYIEETDRFFRHYGIKPWRNYEILKRRGDTSNVLREAGFDTGIRWLKYLGITTQFFTQPFCMRAPVAFLFTSDLRKLPIVKRFGLSEDTAIRLRSSIEESAHSFIRENVPQPEESGKR